MQDERRFNRAQFLLGGSALGLAACASGGVSPLAPLAGRAAGLRGGLGSGGPMHGMRQAYTKTLIDPGLTGSLTVNPANGDVYAVVSQAVKKFALDGTVTTFPAPNYFLRSIAFDDRSLSIPRRAAFGRVGCIKLCMSCLMAR